MKRVLIIGAEGQLGKSFNLIKDEYKDFKFILRNRKELDITSVEILNRELILNKINFIINCAAYNNVSGAEKNHKIAKEVNSDALKNMVKLIDGKNFKLIHISTDYVFDGSKKTKYLEEDPINPINYYGKTKAIGERYILNSNTNSIIIRTSWLFSEFNNNFVKKILSQSKHMNQIEVIKDQYGTPTYAIDLAHFCLKICNEHKTWNQAIFHFANSGSTSRYLFAKKIINKSQSLCKIIPSNKNKDLLRPKNSALSIDKIKHKLNYIPRKWERALEECLSKLL